MLILSRKVGQSIVTGGNVVVKVVRVDGDQIKLGIDAPREISVNREEIQRQQDAGIPPGGVSALKSALGLSD